MFSSYPKEAKQLLNVLNISPKFGEVILPWTTVEHILLNDIGFYPTVSYISAGFWDICIFSIQAMIWIPDQKCLKTNKKKRSCFVWSNQHSFENRKQLYATKWSTVVGHRKGFGIEENPEWILGLLLEKNGDDLLFSQPGSSKAVSSSACCRLTRRTTNKIIIRRYLEISPAVFVRPFSLVKSCSKDAG